MQDERQFTGEKRLITAVLAATGSAARIWSLLQSPNDPQPGSGVRGVASQNQRLVLWQRLRACPHPFAFAEMRHRNIRMTQVAQLEMALVTQSHIRHA